MTNNFLLRQTKKKKEFSFRVVTHKKRICFLFFVFCVCNRFGCCQTRKTQHNLFSKSVPSETQSLCEKLLRLISRGDQVDLRRILLPQFSGIFRNFSGNAADISSFRHIGRRDTESTFSIFSSLVLDQTKRTTMDAAENSERRTTASEQIQTLDKGLGRNRVTSSFGLKAKGHRGCLPMPLFRSFLQFHLNKELTDEQMDHWHYIFGFEPCVQTSQFNMIYAMYDLNGIKRDTGWKNAHYNFKAIDADSSGTVEKEEMIDWLRLAFRSGYLNVQCGKFGPEECFERLQDHMFKTYDANNDCIFQRREFEAMWKDLKGNESFQAQ